MVVELKFNLSQLFGSVCAFTKTDEKQAIINIIVISEFPLIIFSFAALIKLIKKDKNLFVHYSEIYIRDIKSGFQEAGYTISH